MNSLKKIIHLFIFGIHAKKTQYDTSFSLSLIIRRHFVTPHLPFTVNVVSFLKKKAEAEESKPDEELDDDDFDEDKITAEE